MASPPFNINQSLPGDSDIVSQHPGNARTFRDVVESWLLVDGNTSGTHDKVSIAEVGSDPTFGTGTAGFWNRAGVIKFRDESGAITNVATDKDAIDASIALKETIVNVALKAPLASPTFTGTPLAPTATAGTSTTQIATTAFVHTEITAMRRKLLHVQDQKASGTAGGASVSSTWTKRTLNTTVTNEISGASINASSQIILPAGAYEIEATAPADASGKHKAALKNITDGTYEVVGTTEYTAAGTNVMTHSKISKRFTIASQKTFEIQHWVDNGDAVGFGIAAGSGQIEIYTDVKIWEIIA